MMGISPLLRHAIVVLVIFCSGCVSLEQKYPDKRYFVIEIHNAGHASPAQGDRVLLVSNLHISPRYAGTGFVYRTSETAYESDFYNQFLSSPGTMISEEVRKGLAAASAFRYIVGPATELTAKYVLEGSVNALYGDFRNLNAPAAVLEIEFFLRKENSSNPGIELHKRYEKSVAIGQRTPEALARGWDQALQEIVANLVEDLDKAKL